MEKFTITNEFIEDVIKFKDNNIEVLDKLYFLHSSNNTASKFSRYVSRHLDPIIRRSLDSLEKDAPLFIEQHPENPELLCYVTANKLKYAFDVKRKTSIKPARLIARVIKDACPKEIEEIALFFKRSLVKNFDFKLSNDINDILYAYHYENQSREDSGTLGTSCMRHSRHQRVLRDFYEHNTDVVSILYCSDKNGVLARALVWETIEGVKVMDRIYAASDFLYDVMLEKAKELGIAYGRTTKNFNHDYPNSFIDLNTNKHEFRHFHIKLTKTGNFYPYLDTFKFLDTSNLTLHNNRTKNCDYILSEINGNIDQVSVCEITGEYRKDDDLIEDDRGRIINCSYVKNVYGTGYSSSAICIFDKIFNDVVYCKESSRYFISDDVVKLTHGKATGYYMFKVGVSEINWFYAQLVTLNYMLPNGTIIRGYATTKDVQYLSVDNTNFPVLSEHIDMLYSKQFETIKIGRAEIEGFVLPLDIDTIIKVKEKVDFT